MMMNQRSSQYYRSMLATSLGLVALTVGFAGSFLGAFAEGEVPAASTNVMVNTGEIANSAVGNGSQAANGAGVALNNSTNNGNLSNNQNSLDTRNTNQNVNYILPSNANSVQSGGGGSSVLITPRNPLNLTNAALGRSNMGFQFGVQNNPGLQAISGGANALSWFAQGGVTVPFGKIPDVLKNANASQMNRERQIQQEAERNLFGGGGGPRSNQYSPMGAKKPVQKQVEGKVVGLSAYNLAPIAAPRYNDQALLQQQLGAAMLLPQAAGSAGLGQTKILALSPAEVLTQPLNMGTRIGAIEVGKEYAYLGHIQSGWVKVLLPTGETGWAQTQFEYVKNDYTQLDTLTASLPATVNKTSKAMAQPSSKPSAVLNKALSVGSGMMPPALMAPSIIKGAS